MKRVFESELMVLEFDGFRCVAKVRFGCGSGESE
jgi:hypothetical protein